MGAAFVADASCVAVSERLLDGHLVVHRRNTPGTLDQDGISRGDPAMARQCYPGGHCGAGQGGGFLKGQVAGQKHDCFFIEDRIFRQHPVQIGAEPVGPPNQRG